MSFKTKGSGQIPSMGCKQYSDLMSGQPGGQPVGSQGGCCSSAVSCWSLELESTREESSKFPAPSEGLSTVHTGSHLLGHRQSLC